MTLEAGSAVRAVEASRARSRVTEPRPARKSISLCQARRCRRASSEPGGLCSQHAHLERLRVARGERPAAAAGPPPPPKDDRAYRRPSLVEEHGNDLVDELEAAAGELDAWVNEYAPLCKVRRTAMVALSALRRLGAMRVDVLADLLVLDRSSAGSIVRGLETQGLVTVGADRTVGLTMDGRRTATGLRDGARARLLEHMTPHEAGEVAKGLSRIVSALRAERRGRGLL